MLRITNRCCWEVRTESPEIPPFAGAMRGRVQRGKYADVERKLAGNIDRGGARKALSTSENPLCTTMPHAMFPTISLGPRPPGRVVHRAFRAFLRAPRRRARHYAPRGALEERQS